MDRYARHTVLQQIGEAGQQRLAQSSVLVLGCGGLGSMLSEMVVRAGVGMVRIVDSDVVDLSNLHRQMLYDEDDVACGLAKAKIAAAKLGRINSAITIEAIDTRATATNIEELLQGVDLVLDGTDNFATRYLLNRACVRLGKPWIYGGVLATVGMSMNILPGEGPCFSCFLPEPTTAVDDDHGPTCETHGVLATVPQLIAVIQVTEAIKILLASPDVSRHLITIDLWHNSFVSAEVQRAKNCPTCS